MGITLTLPALHFLGPVKVSINVFLKLSPFGSFKVTKLSYELVVSEGLECASFPHLSWVQ